MKWMPWKKKCNALNKLNFETAEEMHTQFELVPRADRHSSYAKNIDDVDFLWIKPDYQPGQHWAFYGSLGEEVYEIIEVGKTQLLLKVIESVQEHEIGTWKLANYNKGSHARSGTPSLRLRLK